MVRIAISVFVLVGPLLVGGCADRPSISYNPYATPTGDPPVLRGIDGVLEAGEQALNYFDARIENWGY